MKKGKYLVFTGLLLILLFSLTACFGSDETDWTSGEITVNGIELTLPFAYRELESIKCSTADQYYNNISDQYVFGSGETEAQLVVSDTVKKGFLSLGCVNTGSTPCTLPNVMVYRIAAEAKNDKTKADLLLPGDVTWGASVEDIVDAYGEPNGTKDQKAREHDDETAVTRLVYGSDKAASQAKAGACVMVLEVHDEKGLQKLDYSAPCQNAVAEDETTSIEKRIITNQPVTAELSSLHMKWQQPSVQFGDKVFGFPLTVNDLKALGFSFSDEGKRTIFNPENTEIRTMTSEAYGQITVNLINMDQELRTQDTVWVDEIILDAGKLKDPSRIKVTGGIGFGSGQKVVAKVFKNGVDAKISDYKKGDSVVGESYEYSLAGVATEQSLYEFGIHSEKGVQRITIKRHRLVFPKETQKNEIPDTDVTVTGEESSGAASSITLPQEVADQYSEGRYYILKPDADYPGAYVIVGGGTDLTLEGNVLSTGIGSKIIRIADKTSGKKYDTSVYLKEETDTARIYVTNAMLQRESIALGGHSEVQTLDASVTILQDKKTGSCRPLDARLNQEDLSSLASRVMLDLNRFSSIRYGVTRYTPEKNGDGSLKPVAQWSKNEDMEYSEYVSGNDYEIEQQAVSRESGYEIVYEVTGQDGQVYVSDIQQIS